jgi:LysM repeat protein
MSRKIFTTRILSTISILFLFISLTIPISAQDKTSGETVLIGGKKYTLYMALPGESPSSIARKFEITLEELYKANPEVKEKLNSGQTVKIPVLTKEAAQVTVSGLQNNENDDHLFSFHSVRRKETVFSIAQKNNITSEDIYQYNPQARDGIKAGDVLKIPKPQTAESKPLATVPETPNQIKHVVKRKETLTSIAKQYNTTEEEILKSNPAIKGSVSKGTVLIIAEHTAPALVKEEQKGVQKYSKYQITGGDNYYQLEKRFGITKEELDKLNPILKDGLNIGMIINIPINESADANNLKSNAIQPNTSSEITFYNQHKAFEIGLFLPFCQNLNDSTRIVQRTASFLEFYSGVLLATEKLTKAGLKTKLFVYDTYQDNKVVEKLVKKPEFLSLDLIIGPVYPENQKVVAELSGKNHIPMISPLSSDSRFALITPDYYQINPGKKLRITGTADYIADHYSDQNIIVLNHGTSSGASKIILDRLNQRLGAEKFRQYNILAGGTSGLEEMLKSDKENIIVLAEGSEANVSVSMTRLNTISKSNKITVVGLQEYTKMQSIDIEHMHNTRLHFLAPYFIDYESSKVNSFIEKYRLAYGSEPTQYSFQGYDIAMHFFTSLGLYGKNFPDTKQIPKIDLLQTTFSFQQLSDFGGYINNTFNIIEYTDNYEVKSAGKIQRPITSDHNDENEKPETEQ